MLTAAGVPIIETIAITSDVIQNRVYAQKLKDVTAQVERGIPMSVPIQKEPALFPSMVSEMVLVGEQTGKMAQILNKLAEYYEKETDTKIKGMASLIEPLLIVVIGAGVGFLVFSVIYPIYSIAQTGF
jgi:type IV pilus assembly protein PilC